MMHSLSHEALQHIHTSPVLQNKPSEIAKHFALPLETVVSRRFFHLMHLLKLNSRKQKLLHLISKFLILVRSFLKTLKKMALQ